MKSILGNCRRTFKAAVCAAMACAVTSVFAWDVEHDEIARLTGEALPAEIRAFFRQKEVAFKMVVTATGDFAYQRPDGIIVCPIGCLKP